MRCFLRTGLDIADAGTTVMAVALSGSHLIAGMQNGKVLALLVDERDPSDWDSVCLHEALPSDTADPHVQCLAFNPSGTLVAVSWANNTTAFYDIKTSARVLAYSHAGESNIGHNNMVLDFSPDGSRVAVSGGANATVEVHTLDPASAIQFCIPENNKERLVDAAVSALHVAMAVESQVVVLDRISKEPVCTIDVVS